jgi:erythronate-4-phosphate dehydrogenase
MIVAADGDIPYIREALAGAGEVRLFAGRTVRPADVREADAIIVRTITRVDAGLLEGSKVRFVGTASAGMDHLEQDYLAAHGTQVASAAGANANSVAEYVVAALLLTGKRRGWTLAEKSIAVVGVGHVGRLVAKNAAALGMEVLLCDPPLRESTGEAKYRDLDEVLGADILTLHVPLTTGGKYATRHMIDRKVLKRLSPGRIVVNSARGDVVSGRDLKQALREQWIEGAILDVWEDEPAIDRELLDLVDVGTAHIAGFSLDGKVRGTGLMIEALGRHWNIPMSWDRSGIFPPPRRLFPEKGARGQDAVRSIVLQAYDILKDDANLRAVQGLPENEAAGLFDRLRNRYDLRPEFSHFIVDTGGEAGLDSTCRALGFEVANPIDNASTR